MPWIKSKTTWDFPGSSVLRPGWFRFFASTARGTVQSLVKVKIPHAMLCGQKQNKKQVATIAIKGTGAENLVSLHWSGCSCVDYPQLQGKLGDIIFSWAMCFAKSFGSNAREGGEKTRWEYIWPFLLQPFFGEEGVCIDALTLKAGLRSHCVFLYKCLHLSWVSAFSSVKWVYEAIVPRSSADHGRLQWNTRDSVSTC